jgi:dTDP-glucose 4,6-dehydratase
MKLLVTGGAGFIGSNFIHYWLKNHPDDKILNLDALTYAGNLENLKDIEDNKRYTFIKGDICNVELVNKIISDIDIIVHFAAETHVDRSIMGSEDFIRTNVEGTRVLLDAARDRMLRFHHVSTDEVFGSLGFDGKLFSEKSRYNPLNPYSASKAAADHLVRAYGHTYNIPVTISNCSNNYGPYMFPEKVIPLFITNLIEGKKIPIYGTGKNIRDWIHVDDHLKGIDFILKRGRVGETYCLGARNEWSNINLARKILQIMGRRDEMIEFIKDRPGHDLRYAIDNTKAVSELGWKPEINFDDGLARIIEWYKENETWWRRIKSGNYRNYYKEQYVNRLK